MWYGAFCRQVISAVVSEVFCMMRGDMSVVDLYIKRVS